MFNNLNWWNVALLLLVALFIFGDKLPQAVSDGLRMLRNLRRMARSATTDLSRELGTDIQLEDLHPKAFIRKHVLSEADQEALVKPLKGLSEDLAAQARDLEHDVREVRDQVDEPAKGSSTPGQGASRGRGAAGSRTYDEIS